MGHKNQTLPALENEEGTDLISYMFSGIEDMTEYMSLVEMTLKYPHVVETFNVNVFVDLIGF